MNTMKEFNIFYKNAQGRRILLSHKISPKDLKSTIDFKLEELPDALNSIAKNEGFTGINSAQILACNTDNPSDLSWITFDNIVDDIKEKYFFSALQKS